MKLSISKIAWVLGLASLAVLCISAIDHKRDGNLAGVEVEISGFEKGEYFLTEDDVRSEVLAMIGEPELNQVGEVAPIEIESTLQHNPFIREANVFVNTEGVLSVTVEQREPIMRVMDQRGESYYVDMNAVRMPVSEHFTARVVVVTGKVDGNQWKSTDQEEWEGSSLHEVVQLIHNDEVLKALVEQIHCTGPDRFVLVPKVGEVDIEFGGAGNAADKLQKLKTFYSTVYKADGLTNYEGLDLSYSERVIAKRKN